MRGMLAPLSPNEEITLRRIALATEGRLSPAYLRRLRQLGLVEEIAEGWRLTNLGHQRYAALDRPILWHGDQSSDELSRMIEAVIYHLIRSLSYGHLWAIAGMDLLLLAGSAIAALTAWKLRFILVADRAGELNQ